MKNNKICPKCKSNDIIRVNGGTGAYGAGNNIPTGRNGITSRAHISVNRYICRNCGYCEEWIDKEDIDLIDITKVNKVKY